MSPRLGPTPPAAPPSRRFPTRLLVIGLAALALTTLGIVAVGLSLPSASDRQVQVSRPFDRPLRVLFVGDSISYGLNATLQDLGFRPLMVDAFAADGP
ncbi:MAG: hypothetical protein LH624_14340, partial [Cryobacterium sp.]|nr:hypothetical protein [Cryobacterium sp.]